MFARKIYAPLFVPAAAALIAADGKKNEEEIKCRPSELPIYTKTDDAKKDAKQSKEPLPPPGAIENFFSSIRQSIMTVYNETSSWKQNAFDLVDDTQKNFDWLIKYLQEEENTNAKIGAIAVGGLAGYILALRGGKFRRFVFTTAGAGGMASICYPEEAAEYSQLAIEEARKYATIAYNFIYGVNKDDPPLALPTLPKLPSSMSEFWGIAADMGKSVKSLISEGEETTAVKVKTDEVIEDDETEILNADEVVSQVYEEASQKACHCPIGVCTRHDEPPPPPPPTCACPP